MIFPRYPSRQLAATAALLVCLTIALQAQNAVPGETAKPGPDAAAAGSEKDVIELSTFEVRGDSYVGYQSLRTVSGSKVNEALLDVPQNIIVLNPEFIEDIDARRVRDAIAYSPNISFGQRDNDREFLFRGLAVAQRFDGFALFPPDGYQDPFIFERIELVKGGNAVLYFNPPAGGLINYVYKKPLAERKGLVGVQLGTNDYVRVEADFTGPLWKGETSSVNYRSLASFDRFDTDFDFENRERMTLSQSFDVIFNKDTNLILRATYSKFPDESRYQRSVHTVNGIQPNFPRSVNAAEPPFAPKESDVFEYAGYLRHTLSADWGLQLAMVFQKEDQDNQALVYNALTNPAAPIKDWLWSRVWLATGRSQKRITSELNLVGDFTTGPVRHKTIVGGTVLFTDIHEYGFRNNTSDIAPINLGNPVYGLIPYSSMFDAPRTAEFRNFDSDDSGINLFAQDILKFWKERIQLTAGIAYFKEQSDTNDSFAGTTRASSADFASPKFAVLFKISPNVSLYAADNESVGSRPGGVDVNGNTFATQRDNSREIGLKANAFGDRVSGTLTYFDTRRQGIAVPDPGNPGFSVQTGEQTFSGWEIDGVVRVSRSLQFIGGLGTMVKNEITSDSRPNVLGREFRNIADVQGGVYGNYAFQSGALKGLELGLGVQYVGKRWMEDTNLTQMDAYRLLNLTASYSWSDYRVSLVVNNLLDEDDYWVYSNGNSIQGQLGDLRQVRVKLIRKF